MLFTAFAGISIVVALVAMYFGARVLGRLGWVLGWLRGMVGLSLIVMATVLILAGLDLLSYKQLLNDKPILAISFEQQGEQLYESTLLNIEEGTEVKYQIWGEQWQIDARVIRWLGFLQMLGAKPGYRLDRLSGRYYSLEDERRKTRSVHQLTNSEYGLDTWAWLKQNGRFIPLIDAVYGSATYLPMEDGAIYQVSLTTNGLVAKPLNPIAEEAISRWQ